MRKRLFFTIIILLFFAVLFFFLFKILYTTQPYICSGNKPVYLNEKEITKVFKKGNFAEIDELFLRKELDEIYQVKFENEELKFMNQKNEEINNFTLTNTDIEMIKNSFKAQNGYLETIHNSDEGIILEYRFSYIIYSSNLETIKNTIKTLNYWDYDDDYLKNKPVTNINEKFKMIDNVCRAKLFQ